MTNYRLIRGVYLRRCVKHCRRFDIHAVETPVLPVWEGTKSDVRNFLKYVAALYMFPRRCIM